jgi:glucose/arabinose dehydrogenase
MRLDWRAIAPLACGPLIAALVSATEVPAQEDAGWLVVPDGFRAQLFAGELAGPWGMTFGPDGRLYVALYGEGRVVRLADLDGDGRADSAELAVDHLDRPIALAWHDGDLWVAEMGRVIRVSGTEGPAIDHEVIVDSLPGEGPPGRSLVFEPSGRAFYLSIAASCDLCRESDPRHASVMRYGLDGAEGQIWARGLRYSAGLAFHPETHELWATEVGRTGLGDRLPPDELNVVRRGRHYGWPYCYGRRMPNPEYADPNRCDVTESPAVALPAGAAPGGIAFYSGGMYPAQYRGDAFVALSGSGDAGSLLAGYKVVRVRFESGRPLGVEDFVTGWLGTGGQVRGRPVMTLVGPDGALYVSDDVGGRIWRVVHGQGSALTVDAGR